MMSWTALATPITAMLACGLGRAANVFSGAAVLNRTTRPTEQYGRIAPNAQALLWCCGARGAVAYALAMKAASTAGRSGREMLGATLFVVLLTTLGLGGSTGFLIDTLGPFESCVVDAGEETKSLNAKGDHDGAAISAAVTQGGHRRRTGGGGGGGGATLGRRRERRLQTRLYDFFVNLDRRTLQPLLLHRTMEEEETDGRDAASTTLGGGEGGEHADRRGFGAASYGYGFRVYDECTRDAFVVDERPIVS